MAANKSLDELKRRFLELVNPVTGRLPVDVGGDIVIENVQVEYTSVESVSNSRFTNLGPGESFTGVWEDVKNYAQISVAVLTDQNSALNGATVDFGHDGTDAGWIRSVSTTIPGGANGQYFTLDPEAHYARFRYTNGPVATSVFKAEVMYKFSSASGVVQPMGATITDANVGSIGRSLISGRLDTGAHTALRANTDRSLDVTVKNPQTSVELGASTLAALENTTVTVANPVTTVAVSNFPVPDESGLTNAELRAAPVWVRDQLSYYSSAEGGRMAFNASTNILTIATTGEQPLAAFMNPSGSGRDVVLWFGEFSSSANTNFRRYRGATITPSAAAQQAANMGGGSPTPVGALYAPPNYTATGGVVSKTAQIGAYAQYIANIHGSVRLRPGQGIRWTITGPGGIGASLTAAVYLEWFERTAEP